MKSRSYPYQGVHNVTNTIQQARTERGLLRRRQVEELVRLSRSTIYAAVKNRTFPAPYRIGVRAVAWKISDLETWLEARPLAGAKA